MSPIISDVTREAEELFHAVADLSPEQRAIFFEERATPGELRHEVEELLRFDSDAAAALTGCVAASAERVLENGQAARIDRRCGPYRLLRLLGCGGMGSVYLAERVDGEIRQQVAVKLLRYGSDEPSFVDRFLRERQILASLNHPGIARLLDAGHTSEGQPYLAMEYIDGLPVDAYAANVDLRRKVGLFLKVCDAVSYAHRNLIVHRDIKPSNILVDGAGEPKLLDFGIAKMIYESADHTRTIDRMLTPDYASPEQVRGDAHSTASDVYSLGAVLRKMLGTAGVPRDLQCILEKALRDEPQDRYGSVDLFADDLRAFLELRPVRARSGTASYRTRKFVRRYWGAVAAAAVVVASLATGLYIADRQRALAQRRFAEVRRLAHTFVFDLHDQIARIEGTTAVRETMVRTGLEYLDQLAADAGGDLELQKEIAEAYIKIGDAEGHPTKPNLGRIGNAMASYRKAGAIYGRIAAENSAYELDHAKFYSRFASLVRFTNDLPQARALSESAIQAFDRARAAAPFDLAAEDAYATAWCTVGDMDEDRGEFQLAWKEFSRCGELARARAARLRDRAALAGIAQAEERIATAARELGRFGEALHALDEDEKVLTELLAAEPLNPRLRRGEALLHQFRSVVYYDDRFPNLGDPVRALEHARRYLAATEEMVRSDPNNTSAQFSRATAMNRVALPLMESNAAGAVALAAQSVKRFDELIAARKSSSLTNSGHAQAMFRLALAQRKAGRVPEARRSAEAALAEQRNVTAANGWNFAEHLMLVQVLILTGQTSGDSGLLREAEAEAQKMVRAGEAARVLPLEKVREAMRVGTETSATISGIFRGGATPALNGARGGR